MGGWSKPRPGRQRDPVPIVQEAGCAPEPVWTGAENLAPKRVRPPDRPPVASRYTDWSINIPFTSWQLKPRKAVLNTITRSHRRHLICKSKQRASRCTGEWEYGRGLTLYGGENLQWVLLDYNTVWSGRQRMYKPTRHRWPSITLQNTTTQKTTNENQK